MSNYHNEIDPFAAQWIRNLIAAGHIAPGDVDERSIEDVRPDDLRGYTQCHFFAGIAVWPYALRLAGWPDDRPVWTGSCPCQPFSTAGQGTGFADERHLWPAFQHLIKERKPAAVLGEQVASKDADAWIDLVQADMEAMGYAFGAVAFPSAGVGAPHIRDRTYWGGALADSDNKGLEGRGRVQKRSIECAARASSLAGRLVHAESERGSGWSSDTIRQAGRDGAEVSGSFVGLADSIVQQRQDGQPGICNVNDPLGWVESAAATSGLRGDMPPGPTNGYWRDADWLGCRDGKWRPVEPGTFPLAHGAAARVGRLRAYGNAINAEAAKAFIEVAMECMP